LHIIPRCYSLGLEIFFVSLEYSKQQMVKIPTPLPDEAYAAINDVYFLRAGTVAAAELITLPTFGLPGAFLAMVSSPVTIPAAAVASGLYYVLGRKTPFIAPKMLAGSTSKENAYAAMGAVVGNIAAPIVPFGAYAEPAMTAGGMVIGRNMA
jgi:hypothetical protein